MSTREKIECEILMAHFVFFFTHKKHRTYFNVYFENDKLILKRYNMLLKIEMNLKSINKLTRCMPQQISDAISIIDLLLFGKGFQKVSTKVENTNTNSGMHKMCICSQPFNLVFLLQLGPHLPISEFALDKKFQCICFKIGHIFYGIYEKTKLLFPFCFSYFPGNKWSMGIEYVDQAQSFHQGLKLFTGNYHQSSTNSEFGGLGPYKFVLLCKCEEKGSQ